MNKQQNTIPRSALHEEWKSNYKTFKQNAEDNRLSLAGCLDVISPEPESPYGTDYKQRIIASFYDIDDYDRVILKRVGTFKDIERFKIELKEGLELTLVDEELEVDGIVEQRNDDDYWAVKINPDKIRNVRPIRWNTTSGSRINSMTPSPMAAKSA